MILMFALLISKCNKGVFSQDFTWDMLLDASPWLSRGKGG